ncbi:hypothetical protein MMC07_003986 [Pseudocyphellaria aurata]|nr:hypothetical protein [Pseudocyphellaria aurata]
MAEYAKSSMGDIKVHLAITALENHDIPQTLRGALHLRRGGRHGEKNVIGGLIADRVLVCGQHEVTPITDHVD